MLTALEKPGKKVVAFFLFLKMIMFSLVDVVGLLKNLICIHTLYCFRNNILHLSMSHNLEDKLDIMRLCHFFAIVLLAAAVIENKKRQTHGK